MGVRWDAVVQDKDFWSEHARQSPKASPPDAKCPICVQVSDPSTMGSSKVRLRWSFAVPSRFKTSSLNSDISMVTHSSTEWPIPAAAYSVTAEYS